MKHNDISPVLLVQNDIEIFLKAIYLVKWAKDLIFQGEIFK